MSGEFDLREIAAGRAYPTATVNVWVEERLFFELAALERKQASETDDDAVNALESQIQKKREELEASALKVHLRGTSRRAREDMQTKALSQFPIRRDVYGRDDDLQAVNRNRYVTELVFAAHIQSIEAPNGSKQDWTEENRQELARVFLDELPEVSVNIVDKAIVALRGDEEMQQGVDFLSRT